jgi:hypothetical protein
MTTDYYRFALSAPLRLVQSRLGLRLRCVALVSNNGDQDQIPDQCHAPESLPHLPTGQKKA